MRNTPTRRDVIAGSGMAVVGGAAFHDSADEVFREQTVAVTRQPIGVVETVTQPLDRPYDVFLIGCNG